MRMKRVTLTLGILVIGVLVLVVLGAPYRVHLGESRVVVLDRLAEAIGLEIHVAGDLILQLGSWIGVEAEQLSVRNPAWKGGQSLLRADRVGLEVALFPLFSGRVKLGELQARNAELSLEWDAEGRFNWQPNLPQEEAADGAGGMSVASSKMHLDLQNARIRVVDARSTTDLTITIEQASSRSQTDGQLMDLLIAGDLDGTPIDVRGSVAPLEVLRQAEKPYPIDIEANVLGLQATAKGNLANPLSGAAVAAAVRLSGKSLAGFAPWLGRRRAAIGPLEAQMQLQGGGSSYTLAPLQLQIGKGKLSGDVHIALGGDRPNLTANLLAKGLDATAWLAEPKEGGGKRASGDAGPPVKVFPANPLALEWMGALDAKVTLAAKAMTLPHTAFRDFNADAELGAKQLDVKVVALGGAGRDLSLHMQLDGRSSAAAAALQLDGDKLSLQALLANSEAAGAVEGGLDIAADLKGSGSSVAAIVAGLDGKVLALLSDGKANIKGMDRLLGGSKALLGQLVTPGEALARVNCAVAEIRFERGKGQLQSLLDTQYSTVVGSGEIDLAAEVVKVRVEPKAKGVTLSIATPVVVEGPLSAPNFRVDEGGLVATLTALVTKVTVPTLILVDAFGQAAAESPCTKLLQDGGPAAGPSAGVAGVGAGAKQEVENLVKGSEKAVEGIFGQGKQAPPESPAEDAGLPSLH